VLSRLFQRLVLEGLTAAFDAGQLHFFTGLSGLNDKAAFTAALAPLRRTDWVVYAKRIFAGPKRVLAYLARYTHRVAISTDRLLGMNVSHVSFRCKDSGDHKTNVITLKADVRMMTMILMRPMTSDLRARTAAAACRLSKASGDRRPALSRYAGWTPRSQGNSAIYSTAQ
jgi:hypothetical protein